MSPIETALARTLLWTSVGAAAGVPTLIVPAPQDPRLTVVIHLLLLGSFAVALVFHLASLADDPWFGDGSIGITGRRAATWITVATVATAGVAAGAAATAVALRYDPSMQYFVVLAAGAIALPTGLAILGGRRRFGPRVAAAAGAASAAIVVWSAWRYLDLVGVGPNGGWIVDGARLGTVVLLPVALCWAGALALFTLGTRRV